MSSYPVYTVEFLGTRNHISLFVETNPTSHSGIQFHVVGNILQGLVFETKSSAPETTVEYISGSKKLVGHVDAKDMQRFEGICRDVEPPGPQLTLSGKVKDEERPLRRCGDWVREVRGRLVGEGVVRV